MPDRTGIVQKYPTALHVSGDKSSAFVLLKTHSSSQHRDVENGDANGTAELLYSELTREAHRNRVASNSALAIVQSVVQQAVATSSSETFLIYHC
jgi:hypothetical protein